MDVEFKAVFWIRIQIRPDPSYFAGSRYEIELRNLDPDPCVIFGLFFLKTLQYDAIIC